MTQQAEMGSDGTGRVGDDGTTMEQQQQRNNNNNRTTTTTEQQRDRGDGGRSLLSPPKSDGLRLDTQILLGLFLAKSSAKLAFQSEQSLRTVYLDARSPNGL